MAKKKASKPPKAAPKRAGDTETYTPQTEWLKNRLKERGVTLDRAAEVLRTYKLMVHRILGGARPVRVEELAPLSRLLGLSIPETIKRFGYEAPEFRVDLIGRVNAEGRIIKFPPNECRKIDAPADAAADMRALIVDAPHSRLSLYDGAILYYTPFDAVDAAAVGRMSVIDIAGQAAPVLGILAHVPGNRKRVTIIGGIETFEAAEIVSAAPVAWIRNS